jgi:HSP20 family protein
MLSTTRKTRVRPSAWVNCNNEKYTLELTLPGVSKADIDIQANENSICITGPREDIEYSACYSLANTINLDKIDAEYDNGILTLTLPLASPITTRTITVN